MLVEYRYAPNASSSSAIGPSASSAPPITSIGRDHVSIPFVIKTNFDLQDYSGMRIFHVKYKAERKLILRVASFDITLTSRLTTRPLENLVVEMNLGEGASGIKCVAARGTGGLGRGGVGMDMGGSGGASWAFDSRKKVSSFVDRSCHSITIDSNRN